MKKSRTVNEQAKRERIGKLVYEKLKLRSRDQQVPDFYEPGLAPSKDKIFDPGQVRPERKNKISQELLMWPSQSRQFNLSIFFFSDFGPDHLSYFENQSIIYQHIADIQKIKNTTKYTMKN